MIEKIDNADLIGKFVLLYCQGVDVQYATGMTIEKIVSILNREFLVGKQPTSLCGKNNWQSGHLTYVAWDSIVQMNIFDDASSFESQASADNTGSFFGLFKG